MEPLAKLVGVCRECAEDESVVVGGVGLAGVVVGSGGAKGGLAGGGAGLAGVVVGSGGAKGGLAGGGAGLAGVVVGSGGVKGGLAGVGAGEPKFKGSKGVGLVGGVAGLVLGKGGPGGKGWGVGVDGSCAGIKIFPEAPEIFRESNSDKSGISAISGTVDGATFVVVGAAGVVIESRFNSLSASSSPGTKVPLLAFGKSMAELGMRLLVGFMLTIGCPRLADSSL